MKTDTSEKGLEALIVADMTGGATAPAGAGAGRPKKRSIASHWD
jgi:hypothetical protein